ncbi:[acyl-carrier-protein] S-malonyltransferase [Streptomyces sp. M1013]|uniref:ACP S-malonyltransferase n=1 Tax=Streptomyces sp. M1013 TaxID=549798 RepID=UPI000978DBD9|nr:ACP S-malonyltransferase [Streptomyces sp. M1013]OMI85942.1 [acyl-carrier-protein] S-malonyltransferase [Streptomyces sp. M1013]
MTRQSAWLFPGQGAQRRGMGRELFDRYPDAMAAADRILGFSVRELCLGDAAERLTDTRYLQPALFVVNELTRRAYAAREPAPDYLAGHSLGEYNALLAADAFDFETGLALVARRGELMGRATGGAMTAVVGPGAARIVDLLAEAGIDDVDLANLNSTEQVVLSGPAESLRRAAGAVTAAGAGRCVPLRVSAAFHSRYMADAAREFAAFLAGFELRDPRIPVIANVTARPYGPGEVGRLLAAQVHSAVRWSESMGHLRSRGVDRVVEQGPGRVLTGLWDAAVKDAANCSAAAEPRPAAGSAPAPAAAAATPDGAPTAGRPASARLAPTVPGSAVPASAGLASAGLAPAVPAPAELAPAVPASAGFGPAGLAPAGHAPVLPAAAVPAPAAPAPAVPAPAAPAAPAAATAAGSEPSQAGARADGGTATPVSGPPAAGPTGAAPERLGSAAFRADYGVRYAYLAGSMYKGIASTELVVRMARAGLLGYFGTGGLRTERIEAAIATLRAELGPDGGFGMNLLHALHDPPLEEATARLFLRHRVRFVEASGFTQPTRALVLYRLSGAHRDGTGRAVAPNRLLAKVSRPEVATAFMEPPPETLVRGLLAEGLLTAAEAEAGRALPLAGEVCAEADSAGHSDAAVAYTLMPATTGLRDRIVAERGYPDGIRVGAAGGLGAPEGLAAAFVLGADFVVTGSVNQCTPQAGTSDAVKDLLAQADIQDTGYAPAGDMFEIGARVQVLRRGTLFAARANKLYQAYRQYDGLEEIDAKLRRTIEDGWFHRELEQVWKETREYYLRAGRPQEVERAEQDPRHRMALVFRWYFVQSTRMAMRGDPAERVNYQIHTGPAIGAFNRFAAGTALADWRNRHVDAVAEALMAGAARVLQDRFSSLAR